MSILIDDLVDISKTGVYTRVGDKTYMSKPLEFYGWYTVAQHIKDAYRVLIGKSRAYHYWEDKNE